jgi:glucosamine--fructose-6-phosphate aminotransferase (isomerizing)
MFKVGRSSGIGSENNRFPLLFLVCGTSYNAGLIGKGLVEGILNIAAHSELASEFVYNAPGGMVSSAIAITQSGETADTLRAMEKVKATGARLIVISNVPNSSATRIADTILYTRTGPEISVAATKSFIAQLIVLYWLVIYQPKHDYNA